MITAALVFAGLAGLLHVYIFTMESLTWTSKRTRAAFGTTPEEAETTKLLAFNQGFYNLFLAIGIAAGIALIAAGSDEAGRAVVLFCCACMVGAGVILLATSRRFFQASLVQALPPLVAIVATFVIS
jgi:putative membrane protein